jgi:O-antigen/teichoic acid export membrane protein
MPFRPRFDFVLWRQYLVTGLPLAGSLVLSMAMLRGDTLLLSLLKPAADVGLYGVPTKMFELTTSLPYMFAGLMMPLLTAAAARALPGALADGAVDKSGALAAGSAGGSEFGHLLGGALDAMLMFGVGAVLALGSFAPSVLTFISGAEFAAGAPALVILSFASLLTALSVVLRFALIALDRPRSVLLADAAACGVALLAYFVLIPQLSFVGAAIGTAVAEAGVLVGMLWGLHRAGQPLPRCPSAIRTLLAGAVSAAGIQVLSQLGTPWLLALVIGGVAYVGLLALTGAIPRELAASFLRKPRASDA